MMNRNPNSLDAQHNAPTTATSITPLSTNTKRTNMTSSKGRVSSSPATAAASMEEMLTCRIQPSASATVNEQPSSKDMRQQQQQHVKNTSFPTVGGGNASVAGSGSTMTTTAVRNARLDSVGPLVAEDDEGSVEYKWRLTNVTQTRFEHLKTQMKFRVTEGQGQCLYEIGVSDDGTTTGLNPEDYVESVETVHRLAESLGFEVRVVHERVVSTTPTLQRCAELMVTRQLLLCDTRDLRIAFCGNTESGKSTLVSVLVHGTLDDGTGTVRQGMFNHKHEVSSGRTSSVSHQVLGFDETGRVTNYDDDEKRNRFNNVSCAAAFSSAGCLTAAENTTRTIAERSVKLVTLTDLGGDRRFSKTALLGMTSRTPGYACICVSVDRVKEDVEQYVTLCRAMKIPFFLVVTKCDTVSELELEDALFELSDVIETQFGLNTLRVEEHADVEMAVATLADCLGQQTTPIKTFPSSEAMVSLQHSQTPLPVSPSLTSKQNVMPLFVVSSVEGTGIPLLKQLLHKLPVPPVKETVPTTPTPGIHEAVEVLLDNAMKVSGVGTVLCGYVARGTVRLGDTLMIGPDKGGVFSPVQVCGIHVKGSHVNIASTGLEVTVSIGDGPQLSPQLVLNRKGLVLVNTDFIPDVCKEFEMAVSVLTKHDIITVNQEPVVHARNIRQAARIVSITSAATAATANPGGSLCYGQEGTMRCRFLYTPEALCIGSTVLLRWNQHAKLIGTVTSIFPVSPSTSPSLRPRI